LFVFFAPPPNILPILERANRVMSMGWIDI